MDPGPGTRARGTRCRGCRACSLCIDNPTAMNTSGHIFFRFDAAFAHLLKYDHLSLGRSPKLDFGQT